MNKETTARLLLPALLALLSPAATAQRPDVLVRSDLAFAEGLASRYRYTDLAEQVVAAVEAAGVSEEVAEDVALAKCDILAEGARYEGDPAERLTLYGKALAAYDDFLEEFPYSELRPQAEAATVDLTVRYAQHLQEAIEEAVGEEASAWRETLETTLDDGLERVDSLIEGLEELPDRTTSEDLERWRWMLAKGQMLTVKAEVSEEGTYYFQKAQQVLEDVALEAPDTSGASLQAFLYLGRAKAPQGQYDEAAEYALYVVDKMVPMDPDVRASEAWLSQPFEDRQRRWDLVQIAMPDLLEDYENAGNTEDGVAAALYFYNVMKGEGYTIGPLGHLSLLGVARTLMQAGGYVGGSLAAGDLRWFETSADMRDAGFRSARDSRSAVDLALQIAQDVNSKNKGNVLQVRAQKLISQAIERPGVEVSPEVLLEAADGEFYAKNYARALATFRRLSARLQSQDEATRLNQMPRVLEGVGRSLERLGRPLEAAMAYREAATRWNSDPEYQLKNARGYYRAIGTVHKAAEGDARVHELYLEAESLAAQASEAEGGAGEIHWRRGERAYGEDDYATAREEYLQVDPGEDVFEKARVKASLCLYKQGDYDAARKEFTEYLTSYVPDPANTVTTRGKLDTRSQASAMATYYLGLMASKEGRQDDVVRWLGSYDSEYGEQGEYAPAAMRLLLKARIAQEDLAAMRDVLDRMVEKFGDHPQTGASAAEAARALAPLIDAAQEAKDEERVVELKTERAQYLELANQVDRTPNYPNLRNEAVLWIELGAWEKAEASLRRILSAFGESKEYAEEIESRVEPDLGFVLLKQKRVPEAFEVLDPLVPDPDDDEDARKPRKETVVSWCRAVCGWVEGEGDTIVEVPGVGEDEDFADATTYWVELTDREEAWSCTWYDFKFQTVYGYWRWGQLDSTHLAQARDVLENLRVTGQDPRFELVSARCGDETLRNRFLWLWEKVR